MKLCREGFQKNAVDFRVSTWRETEGEEMLFAEIGRGEVIRIPEENHQG